MQALQIVYTLCGIVSFVAWSTEFFFVLDLFPAIELLTYCV